MGPNIGSKASAVIVRERQEDKSMTMNEVVAIKAVIQDTLHCGACRLLEGILPQYLKQSEGLGFSPRTTCTSSTKTHTPTLWNT